MFKFALKNVSFAKEDFPFFQSNPNVNFLDNASTTQKPMIVLSALSEAYIRNYSSPGRGIYSSAYRMATCYQESKLHIAEYIGLCENHDIVITSGCTESINLVARSISLYFHKEYVVLIPIDNHNSHVTPWLQDHKAHARFIELNEGIGKFLCDQVKVVCLTQYTNLSGKEYSVSEIVKTIRCYNKDIIIFLDSTQAVSFLDLDAGNQDVDFITFSGHKVYGPNGIGVLGFHKRVKKILDMGRNTGGGVVSHINPAGEYEYIDDVWEAGTLNVPNTISLAKALQYTSQAKRSKNLCKRYDEMNKYISDRLTNEYDATIISHFRGPIVSFFIKGVSSYDISLMISKSNICIRAGDMCCHMFLHRYRLPTVLRISLALYNSYKDLENFFSALTKVITILQ